MIEQAEADTAGMQSRWRKFYEKLRSDMIEAQCALESGHTVRASELMDSILQDARRAGLHFEPPRRRRRRN